MPSFPTRRLRSYPAATLPLPTDAVVGVDHSSYAAVAGVELADLVADVADKGSFVADTRELTAGTGLTGGGDLSADRTFNIDPAYVDGRIAVQKGAANGLATLDSGGKVPTAQLPPLAITETFVVASQAAMLALAAQEGDVAVRTDLSKTFILSTNSPSTLADWVELLSPTDAVTSVNGHVGVVSLGTGDVAESGGNLYYTDVRARNALSSGDGITYNGGTGAIAVAADVARRDQQNIFQTSVAGDYLAKFYNSHAGGYGLNLRNGNDANVVLAVANAADSAQPHRLYGNGDALFAVGGGLLSSGGDLTCAADLTCGGKFTLGTYLTGGEIANPAAPSASHGTVYFRDSGAGKTQIVVMFDDGVPMVMMEQA